jgi:hypothetical protein
MKVSASYIKWEDLVQPIPLLTIPSLGSLYPGTILHQKSLHQEYPLLNQSKLSSVVTDTRLWHGTLYQEAQCVTDVTPNPPSD